jgi:hypothetical protein
MLVMDGMAASDVVQLWSACGIQLLSKIKTEGISATSASSCFAAVVDIITRLSSFPLSAANSATTTSASSAAAAAAAAALQQLLAIASASPANAADVARWCASIIRSVEVVVYAVDMVHFHVLLLLHSCLDCVYADDSDDNTHPEYSCAYNPFAEPFPTLPASMFKSTSALRWNASANATTMPPPPRLHSSPCYLCQPFVINFNLVYLYIIFHQVDVVPWLLD